MKITFILFILFIAIFNYSHAKVIYTEPVNNAEYVSIHNNIIISFDRNIQKSDLNSLITVTGSISGKHNGEIVTSSDRSIIFKPHQPFSFNEKVYVELKKNQTSGNSLNSISFSFNTEKTKHDFEKIRWFFEEVNTVDEIFPSGNYSSLPVPPLTANISNNPTSGLIYVNNFRNFYNEPHLIIANNDGSHYFTRQTVNHVLDFKRNPNGVITYFSRDRKKFISMDNDYNVVDSFYCGNGYSTDQHDIQILSNGNYLLMSYDPQSVDMSQIIPGGDSNAIVTGLIIQELDPDRNVIFQWRSWDHFNITDANNIDLTDTLIDYVHGNAIEQDNDGNLLISSRHMSEITKINRTTGDIIWRLGGINNEFTFPNDTVEISYQHDIRRIENGNITLYDNGNYHSPNFSRAVEYQLDETNKIATLVWQYRNDPEIYGNAMGSAQRLSNGNTFICWGASQVTTFTEVTPEGEIALELTFEPGIRSYRGFFEILDMNLELKYTPEGFYNNITKTLNMSDTVTVYIRNAISPFNIIDTSRAVVDSVSLVGNFNFNNTPTGTYYITVKHRNSLETWSKTGGELFTNGTNVSYDMTDLSSKAFGNNLTQVDTSPPVYAAYSGDVNNDKYIELFDLLYIYNDAAIFKTGYELSDLSGDNNTDISDVIIAFNNLGKFVEVISP